MPLIPLFSMTRENRFAYTYLRTALQIQVFDNQSWCFYSLKFGNDILYVVDIVVMQDS